MFKEKIIEYIGMVSNQNLGLNILSHLLVFTAILTIFLGKNKRVKQFVANGVIFILFLFVTIIAVINGNPVHFLTFGLMAIFAFVELCQGKNEFNIRPINIRVILSFTAIIIGFWYPEFVRTNLLAFLILSPAGIIPCPTLLIVLGILTLAYPNVNKAQYTITTLMGVFYGFIGVFQLKVYLDIALMLFVGYAFYCMSKSRLPLKDNQNVHHS